LQTGVARMGSLAPDGTAIPVLDSPAEGLTRSGRTGSMEGTCFRGALGRESGATAFAGSKNGVAPLAKRNGLMLVFSSPSGAGKTTLTRMLLERDDNLDLSISVTTRPPRPGEVHGKSYFFISPEEFARLADDGTLLEHAEVFGNRYGTPRVPVEEAIGQGRDVVFDVDWQGAQRLRLSASGRPIVSIFILPPSIGALAARLAARGQDSPEVIGGRMERAWAEIAHWAEYDYVLINDDLSRCFAEIETIIAAERLRLARQPGVHEFVEGLNAEFEKRASDGHL